MNTRRRALPAAKGDWDSCEPAAHTCWMGRDANRARTSAIRQDLPANARSRWSFCVTHRASDGGRWFSGIPLTTPSHGKVCRLRIVPRSDELRASECIVARWNGPIVRKCLGLPPSSVLEQARNTCRSEGVLKAGWKTWVRSCARSAGAPVAPGVGSSARLSWLNMVSSRAHPGGVMRHAGPRPWLALTLRLVLVAIDAPAGRVRIDDSWGDEFRDPE